MKVRVVRGREKLTLQPWRRPWVGPHRVLDAGEQAEMIHLYRTRQGTARRLASRFGISERTLYRYVHAYPPQHRLESAGKRVDMEARRMGLRLTRDDALRLAAAAMLGEDVA